MFCKLFEIGKVQKCADLVGLKNATITLLAIGFDTAESDPSRIVFLNIVIPQMFKYNIPYYGPYISRRAACLEAHAAPEGHRLREERSLRALSTPP